MSIEENKEVVRRFWVWANNVNTIAVDEIITDDFVLHNLRSGVDMEAETVKQVTENAHVAFANATFTVDDLIAEGDKVALRLTFRGTHKGRFRSVAPTGKNVGFLPFWKHPTE